ncbi:MAG: hypothetical protein Kow00127_03870 [Bacteroidales bacterium]
MKKRTRLIKRLSFGVLTIMLASMMLFALLSGAGPSISGIVKNSPNTLPWLALLGLLYVLRKRPVALGITIVLASILLMVFFVFTAPVFYPELLAIFILLLVCGAALFYAGWMEIKN